MIRIHSAHHRNCEVNTPSNVLLHIDGEGYSQPVDEEVADICCQVPGFRSASIDNPFDGSSGGEEDTEQSEESDGSAHVLETSVETSNESSESSDHESSVTPDVATQTHSDKPHTRKAR